MVGLTVGIIIGCLVSNILSGFSAEKSAVQNPSEDKVETYSFPEMLVPFQTKKEITYKPVALDEIGTSQEKINRLEKLMRQPIEVIGEYGREIYISEDKDSLSFYLTNGDYIVRCHLPFNEEAIEMLTESKTENGIELKVRGFISCSGDLFADKTSHLLEIIEMKSGKGWVKLR